MRRRRVVERAIAINVKSRVMGEHSTHSKKEKKKPKKAKK
jgi:hypothetical protein